MKVLAIDPGARYNGIAMYDSALDKYFSTELLDHKLVWQLVVNGDWDYVLCEDFTAEFISHYGIATVRIVGGVEALCWNKNIKVSKPKAKDRLPYIARAKTKLTEIHGFLPVRDHQESAMAHLLRFLDKLDV